MPNKDIRPGRAGAMADLAAALQAAHAGADWERVAALAQTLPALLHAWAAAGPLNHAERAALASLRDAHARAAAAGDAVLDTLDGQLAALRNHKDGWLAYALASDTENA